MKEVDEASPAGRGGVRRFDVIRKFNDQIVVSSNQLETLIKALGKGKRVRLTLIRGGRGKVVPTTLDERGPPENIAQEKLARPFTGSPQLPHSSRIRWNALASAPMNNAGVPQHLKNAI